MILNNNVGLHRINVGQCRTTLNERWRRTENNIEQMRRQIDEDISMGR